MKTKKNEIVKDIALTSMLWIAWGVSAYLVVQDVFSGEFLGYAQGHFWLSAGLMAILGSGLLYWQMPAAPKLTAVETDMLGQLESATFAKAFGASGELIAEAKIGKNLTVEFEGARCSLHPPTKTKTA